MLYYDKKFGRFVEQKTPTKSPHKILLTAERLRTHKAGTYGPIKLKGQYFSRIDGVEFCWDDLAEMLVVPEDEIRVYAPGFECENIHACL